MDNNSNNENKKSTIATITYGLFVILILVGASYAVWNYSFLGSGNTITQDEMEIEFLESSNEVIGLTNAIPLSDEEGRNQPDTFDFQVRTKTANDVGMSYNLVIEKLEALDGYTLLNDNEVKVYLTDYDGNVVVAPTLVSDLDNYVLYTKTNLHSSSNIEYKDKYKLRIWIDNSVTGEGWTESTKLQYNFKIGVKSNQKAKTNDLADSVVTLSNSNYIYDGSAKVPSITVKYDGKTLTKDTDYTVTYSDNTNAGVASVVITGKGDYTGTVTKKFIIDKAQSVCTISTMPTLSYPSETTGSIVYNCTGDGEVKTTSSNTQTIELGTTTSTSIPLTVLKKGSSTITIKQEGTTNYKKSNEVTKNISVGLSSYTVNIVVQNGTVDTASKQVEYQQNGTFTISTSTGYNTPTVSCTNSQSASISGSTLTVSNVTNDTTCTVTHTANTYQVRYNANGGYIPKELEMTSTSGDNSLAPMQFNFTATSEGDNLWEKIDGVWRSGNYNVANSYSNLTSEEFTITETATLSFDWAVSSEDYDYLYYTIYDEDGFELYGDRISGNKDITNESDLMYTTVETDLIAGTYTIGFSYEKDESVDEGLDRGYVKNITIPGSDNMANSTFTYGVEDNLKSNEYIKTGYTFQGWSTSSSGVTVNYQNGATIKNLTSENNKIVDLYAVWKINSYDVNVVVQNGTVDTATKSIEHGQNGTFNLTPDSSDYLPTVTCTNNQTGTITNNILTVSNVTQGTTCIVKYATEMTTLYEDGTLIINENLANRSSNIEKHGAVTDEYGAMDETNSYVFKSSSSRPWSSDSVTSMEIGSNIKPISIAYWVRGLKNMTTGDFTKLDTSSLTDMSFMFCEAGYNANTFNLIGLNNWDISSVTNMESMFAYAGYKATTFNIGDLSGWDTSKVTYMGSMFSEAGWSATTWSIGDLSSWNTSKVTSMDGMFDSAGRSATTFNIGDLSSWNTSKVKSMSRMFGGAGRNATTFELDLSGWDTSSVTDMGSMFGGAGRNATTWSIGDLSGWDTSSVTDMGSMFEYAGYNATTFELDLSGWDTSSVTDMYRMFYEAGYSATDSVLIISNWNPTSETSTSHMFYNVGFKTIYCNNDWSSLSNIVSSNDMFNGATKLVGGNGTTYNSSYIDKTYARPDTSSTPGYFTNTLPKTVNVVVQNGTVNTASKQVELNQSATFTISTSVGYNTPTVSCTNSQSASISGSTLTVSNVTKNTTCTVVYQPNTYQVRYNSNGGALEVTTMTSTGTNPWEEIDGVYRSGNYHVASSTSTLTSEEFTLTETKTISFEWAVSSESASYDYLYYTIYKDGSALSGTGTSTKIGGNSSITDEANLTYTKVEKELTAGTYTIEFTYKKDSSVDKGLDRGYVKNIKTGIIDPTKTMSNSTFSYDIEDNLKSNEYIKEGYTFQGWSTSSSGVTVNYQNGATIKNLTSENNKIIDLYAVWKINSYDVNVVVQNGTVDTATKTVEQNQSATFNLTPEVSGTTATVTCTNSQTGSITNNVLTVSNVTKDTTCTVKYVTEMTTLYTDGTLIINENLANRSSNITTHGAVTNEYDAMSSSNSYVMSGYSSQPWANERDNITSIEIDNEIHPTSTAYWFHSLRNVSYGDFTNLKTENVTSMYMMFSSLGHNSSSTTFELIGLDNWDTSKVTNMSSMFDWDYLNGSGPSYAVGYNATTWSIGDLSGWDTSSVTNMSYMFNYAGENATTWTIGDLSGWDTSSVINMHYMFRNAGYNATTWSIGDLSSWNTSKVTDMSGMFNCAGRNATTFNIGNLSNWNTSSVTDMGGMFSGAGSSTTTWSIGDLSGWNTSSVTDMGGMFSGAGESATTFDIGDLSSWNTSSVTDMNRMFYSAGESATNWSIGDLSSWDTSSVTNMSSMFDSAGYNAITFNIGDLSGWDTSSVTNMSSMFQEAGYNANTFNLTGLNNWNTSSVTSMYMMFYNAGRSATTWSIGNLSSWNTSSVTNMAYMFNSAGYSATTWSIGNLSSWNTSSVTNMAYMFNSAGYSATTWTIGDLSSWDTSNVTNMSSMFAFAGESATTWSIGDLSGWDTSSVTNMSSMFNYAGESATTFDISFVQNWNTSSVTNMSRMFYKAGYKATTWSIGDLSNWDTSSVTTMWSMFSNAGESATTFNIGDLSSWDTSSVINMSSMFYQAGRNATTFNIGDLSSWDTSSVTNMSEMFSRAGYTATWSLNCSSWNVNLVTRYSDFNTGVESKVTAPTWVN